jgi:hypothetical protein
MIDVFEGIGEALTTRHCECEACKQVFTIAFVPEHPNMCTLSFGDPAWYSMDFVPCPHCGQDNDCTVQMLRGSER